MRLSIFLLAFLTLSFGCEKKDVDINNCDYSVFFNHDLYNHSSTANFSILDATISDDCLNIKMASSGCDGNSWVVNLYDSEAIGRSKIPQRFLRFDLINKEECEAWITKFYSFDISELKDEQYDKILLNLKGYDKRIEY